MRKSLIGVLTVVLMVLVGTSVAKASAAELMLESGGATPITTSLTSYTNTNFNGWDISLEIDSSSSPTTSSTDALGLMSYKISCSNSTCESNPLTIFASDIGFTSTIPGLSTFYGVQSETGSSASTSESSYYDDPGNAYFGTVSLIGTVGPFTHPDSGGGGVNTPISGTYSLTIGDTFTAGGSTATFGGAFPLGLPSIAEISASPEPATMLLFGSGLLLFGIVLRKQLHAR